MNDIKTDVFVKRHQADRKDQYATPTALSERLKDALIKAGLKQIELSRMTGIDTGTINNYLSGKYKPKQDKLYLLAEALKVDPVWLMGYDVPMRCYLSSNLNDRIKEMRKKNGLTLLEVAEFLGVKEATVQRYESGNIKNLKIETISKLADLFGCDPQYLVGWTKNNSGLHEATVTDEEKMLLELFRRVPEDSQRLVLDMIRTALKRDR